MPAKRRIAVFPANGTPTYDARFAETFKVMLPQAGAGHVVNFAPGILYVFIIQQPSGGGQAFAWPPECATSTGVEQLANAVTVQAFIAEATGLVPSIPGTWN